MKKIPVSDSWDHEKYYEDAESEETSTHREIFAIMRIIEKIEKIQHAFLHIMLEYYLSQLQSPTPTIPVVIDELSAFECVSRFSGIHITSFEDIYDLMPRDVSIYEKPEDKKQL